jgi:hypothetical protein
MPRHENKPSVQIVSVDVTANVDFVREGLRLLVQVFIELELSDVIEASPHERSSNRRSYRNGYRRRTWMTSLGELTLEIPKLRKGTYYPAFFDTFRQSEAYLIESAQPEQIAEIVEQIYDLVDRFRDKPRLRYPDGVTLYRPVNAISTRTIDTSLSDDTLPKSLYMGNLALGQMDNWLSESLDVLIRVHRALADVADAVAA